MRLTSYLCRQSRTYQWKQVWKYQGKFHEPKLRLPRLLEENGISPEDPARETTVLEPWKPPVDDPRFWKAPPETELPDYQEVPARLFSRRTRLTFGSQQACILTKAQSFRGLPPSVQSLVNALQLPDQERLVQRCIMLSQKWNPTKEKLPHRVDKENIGWKLAREWGIPRKKAARILITSLLHLCQSASAEVPALLEHRRLLHAPYLDTHFYFEDKLVNILGHVEFMLTSDVPLPAFADEATVDQSVNVELPSIEPSYPTLDLLQSHRYTVQNLSAVEDTVQHRHPHTLVLTEGNHWKTEERLATALMYCFGHATTTARKRFGEDVRTLPEPVCVQCVSLDERSVNFVFFQLNTLNLASRDGVKNLVWFDSGNQFFHKELPKPWKGPEFQTTRYSDYDETVFPRLLALYLHGLPGLESALAERKVAKQ